MTDRSAPIPEVGVAPDSGHFQGNAERQVPEAKPIRRIDTIAAGGKLLDSGRMINAPTRLIVFSGLPGTGKTTVARAVAERLAAAYLRVDVIEQSILNALPVDVQMGAVGYAVANRVAESNLSLGVWVVADCVNPIQLSRAEWRATARKASATILEVEVICSDRDEHRRLLERRRDDIPGHQLPSWEDVERLVYEAWTEPHLVVDTALLSPSDAEELVVGSSS